MPLSFFGSLKIDKLEKTTKYLITNVNQPPHQRVLEFRLFNLILKRSTIDFQCVLNFMLAQIDTPKLVKGSALTS